MKLHFKKHFTIDDARSLLPDLRRVFQDIHRRQDQVRHVEGQLTSEMDETGGDVGGSLVAELYGDLLQVNAQLRRIQSWGVEVKDIDRGLVDFPHIRDGEEVLLCWELDEDDIEFWHGLHDGYSGREPLID